MEKRRGQDQGPHLHLKLSNEIYNNMRLCAVKRGDLISNQRNPPPPLFSSFSSDKLKRVDGWCDLMRWRVEEVKLYNRK